MVYRGKPSSACAECRKLRSRCDKKIPACGQCIKAGRGCSGYRSAVDLMFLDESKRVASQNRSRAPSGKNASSIREGNKETTEQAESQKLSGFVMYQPLADLGVNFFMTNFIVDDPAMSLIHYLPNFYARIGFSAPALTQMCAAVGLVGLANKSHRKDMFNVATTNYAAAIRAINNALLCPQRAAQDSILASIFLAAMFEALIIPRNEGMDNCCTHLAGAVSVAHLMLNQGKHTAVTIQQCTTIVKTVIMNCWVQEVSLPPHFLEFKKLVEKKAARVSVHDLFLEIVIELLQFKKFVQSKVRKDPMVVIQKALAIDVALKDFARTLHHRMPFNTFQLPTAEDCQRAYRGYYHLYPQHLQAHLWNNLRSARIRLHQVILRECQDIPSSPSMSAQQIASKAVIIFQTTEMIASLPQLAGYLKDLEVTAPPVIHNVKVLEQDEHGMNCSKRHRVTACVPEYNPHSLYHILYQLYIYGSEPCLPQTMRDWIQDRISWMENKADPLDLAGLQDTVRRQLWIASPSNKEEHYENFRNELRSPVSPEFEGVKVKADPATNGFRLGGNNFLHREAVSAGGMHSCSSVACEICNI